MTGISTTKLLIGAAALALGLGAPAVANATHFRHHHRHFVRVLPAPVVVAPVATIYDNPLYIPGEHNDPDLGATPADGLELGRDAPVLSTADVAHEFGIAPTPGFDLEAPPIGDRIH